MPQVAYISPRQMHPASLVSEGGVLVVGDAGHAIPVDACGYPSRLLKTAGRDMDFADFGESYAQRDSQFSPACVSNLGHAGSSDRIRSSARLPVCLRDIRLEVCSGSEEIRADAERSLTKKKRTDANFDAGRGA